MEAKVDVKCESCGHTFSYEVDLTPRFDGQRNISDPEILVKLHLKRCPECKYAQSWMVENYRRNMAGIWGGALTLLSVIVPLIVFAVGGKNLNGTIVTFGVVSFPVLMVVGVLFWSGRLDFLLNPNIGKQKTSTINVPSIQLLRAAIPTTPVVPSASMLEISQNDVDAIREYCRRLAQNWWGTNSMESAICDKCNSPIPRESGYLIGSYIHCENCGNEQFGASALARLRTDPDFFGRGLLDKARNTSKQIAENGQSASTKCMVCQKDLNFERKVSSVLFGDQLSELIQRTAYKCRNCGSLICMNCAQTNRCQKCGGNAFDRAIG